MNPGNVKQNWSVEFFEAQFQRQVRERDYALNPFETLALGYLSGTVLDLGCGLGNLSLEAGRRGHRVLAVDASPTAVARINADAQREGLPVEAIQADIENWTIDRSYDTIVAIGLLMFFRREHALKLLGVIQEHVNPGGRAIVNVLIEGTTYMGMFHEDNYYLFRRNELEERFAGWKILSSRRETFPAPGETRKEFSTIIAEKPGRAVEQLAQGCAAALSLDLWRGGHMAGKESPMAEYRASINRQYGQSDLEAKLLAALQRAGKDIDALTADDLAPFEEIHIRGREATRDLARMAQLSGGMEVLDVGSGIGGPARTLAAEFGCRVTGLDLTENYISAAEMLTARLGLSDKVAFRLGNALDMPFEGESFDVVWMQHIAMNIQDKRRLFREVRRVLRPRGRLALYEILAGSTGPPHFPVPWASEPSLSFLVAPAKFHRFLTAGGFRELAWLDDSERCIQWYRALFAARTAGAPPPIGLELVLGPDFPEKGRNVLRNLEENRIVVIRAVFERTG